MSTAPTSHVPAIPARPLPTPLPTRTEFESTAELIAAENLHLSLEAASLKSPAWYRETAEGYTHTIWPISVARDLRLRVIDLCAVHEVWTPACKGLGIKPNQPRVDMGVTPHKRMSRNATFWAFVGGVSAVLTGVAVILALGVL